MKTATELQAQIDAALNYADLLDAAAKFYGKREEAYSDILRGRATAIRTALKFTEPT